MSANVSKVYEDNTAKRPGLYKRKEEYTTEISRLIGSLESIQLRHGSTIISLDSLKQLGPVVAEILPEMKRPTLVHTYCLLARRLNALLSPHGTSVPTCLLEKGIGFFSSYKISQPADTTDMCSILSHAFGGVHLGEYSERRKIPRLTVVPTLVQEVPAQMRQILNLGKDKKQDYLNEFHNRIGERIARIQSKTNKAALASIVPTVTDIVIDPNGQVILSSAWYRKIGCLDESIKSVLDELLLDIRGS